MKEKGLLQFLLYGAVDIESCVMFHAEKGEMFSAYFGDLCDDTECDEGEYFACWSPTEDYGYDRAKMVEYGNIPDYELPTSDGWWQVVRIGD